MNNINASAEELAYRWKQGITGPLLSKESRPRDFTQAFILQQAVGVLFAGVTADDVAGWKCGLPIDGKTIVGALYTDTVQDQLFESISCCKIYPNQDGLAVVEPELCFELSSDLPAREEAYSEAEIDAAVGGIRLALELIQSRYDDTSEVTFFDALADGLVNQGLWLGSRLSEQEGIDLTAFNLCIEYADGRSEQLQGKHPNGNPRAGLYWLVNFLSEQGVGLKKGQQIITGSYAGVLKLPMKEEMKISYGELGSYLIQFEALRGVYADRLY